MKKVKPILSFVHGLSTSRKCTALFSATVLAFTSVTCAAQFSEGNAASVKLTDAISTQKILELSESYLSPNMENNISILRLPHLHSLSAQPEVESAQIIKELSTDSESEEKTTLEEKTTSEEKNTSVEKTTEKEKQTTQTESRTEKQTVPTTLASVAETEQPTTDKTSDAQAVAASSGGYTFAQLGIKQMSDIPVPDDILFDSNGIPLNYKRKLSGKSTTYNMGSMTATGTRVHPGVVAVNPNIIPYGSKMYIVASDGSGYVYGYSSAEDTGGFIYWDNGPLVDLYVYTYADCCYWGNKPVTIYIF